MIHEAVLRHAPWSISKVGMLEKCSKQYHHKYVVKHKEGPKSAESRVGVVGHALLEQALQLPGSSVDDLAYHLIEEHGLTTKEAQEVLDEVPWAKDFVNRAQAFKAEHGVSEEYVEKKLAIQKDFTRTDFFDNGGLLRGVLDLAWVTRDNVMICVDHKFGKRKNIKEHEVQFNAYRLMIVANWPVIGVQCAINYAGAPKLDWAPIMTRQQIVADLPAWLMRYLNYQSHKLTMIDEGDVRPEVGWQCEWCGYSGVCEPGTVEVAKRKAAKLAKAAKNL